VKKTVSVLLILVLACSVAFTQAKTSKKPLIGVSIWSSTDTLGSQFKRILDAAAKALDVNIMYVDQGHILNK
jgi:ribose transport system substrate-binding protein